MVRNFAEIDHKLSNKICINLLVRKESRERQRSMVEGEQRTTMSKEEMRKFKKESLLRLMPALDALVV